MGLSRMLYKDVGNQSKMAEVSIHISVHKHDRNVIPTAISMFSRSNYIQPGLSRMLCDKTEGKKSNMVASTTGITHISASRQDSNKTPYTWTYADKFDSHFPATAQAIFRLAVVGVMQPSNGCWLT